MITNEFQGKTLSLLGFGAMRLPRLSGGEIDEKQVEEMVRLALQSGINYFDTAYPYHEGNSEIVLGKALSAYPRDSFYLATKFPGHQATVPFEPSVTFEKQLQKCGVDYFDFYLMHNVSESSIGTYTDPERGILEYLKEQKRLGRIKHLGFSCHGDVNNLKEFLDYADGAMEFCQIQLNYLDWTLQDAKAKVELLNRYNVPIWGMEPVRGGKLAALGEAAQARLRALRPDESDVAWCFRFLQDMPGVTMILSGMSDLTQLEENIKTFAEQRPLTDAERDVLLDIAEGMKDSVPCTACRYCCDGCPQQIDIPKMLSLYNEARLGMSPTITNYIGSLDPGCRPSACIGCGACSAICPQNIDVPAALAALDGML